MEKEKANETKIKPKEENEKYQKGNQWKPKVKCFF